MSDNQQEPSVNRLGAGSALPTEGEGHTRARTALTAEASQPRQFTGRLTRGARSTGPDLAALRRGLWGPTMTSDSPALTPEQQSALLEQYKLYVEMADRVSARRGQANTFFLTINTAVFTVIGFFWAQTRDGFTLMLALPWTILLVQCVAWFLILRSYRQLNGAKFAVIGAMEERLPASPYWGAEWAALGSGQSRSRYWPLSHVEQWVPILFAAGYMGGLLTALIA